MYDSSVRGSEMCCSLKLVRYALTLHAYILGLGAWARLTSIVAPRELRIRCYMLHAGRGVDDAPPPGTSESETKPVRNDHGQLGTW